MPFRCADCRFRSRADGTCKNQSCARYVAPRQDERWKRRRLKWAFGEVAVNLGDFVHGARVASLNHRHDIRMGIASGMLLRERIADAPLRMEVLCVAFLLYWKWPAAGFLRCLLRRAEAFLEADAQGRASLHEQAWTEAAAVAPPLADFSVVCHVGRRTVELRPRAEVPALVRRRKIGNTEYRTYSLGKAPSKRRTAAFEFAVLMRELRSGRLGSALTKVAEALAAPGATYSACEEHLKTVKLWEKATYSRLNFLRWLFKAEGVAPEMCERDWALLTGMGSGAEQGVSAVGGLTYEDAVDACEVVSRHVLAAPGASSYGLGDLVCFLCLSQTSEAAGSNTVPLPAAPVDVASDLGDMAGSCAQVPPRKRLRAKTTQAGESRQPPAAGSSEGSGAAASGARRPALPVWRAGVLEKRMRFANPPSWGQVLNAEEGGTRVGEIVVGQLPLRDQVVLGRASHRMRATCVRAARAWGPHRWNEVRALAAQTLLPNRPVWAQFCASSASGSGLAIAAASAAVLGEKNLSYAAETALQTVDLLAARGPIPGCKEVVALACARWGLKIEFGEAGVRTMAREFAEGGRLHLPNITAVEELVAEAGRPPMM